MNLEQLKGKVVLITGGTGSIGSELAYQLLKFNPRQIRILSRDESKQYELLERLGRPANVRILIGDIRDKGPLYPFLHGDSDEHEIDE